MVCLSCSNNDEKITDSESITMTQSLSERDIQNLKQLNRDIQSYNISFVQPKTRGLRSWISKALTVVAADGIGLFSGGPGSSALYSGVALVGVLAGVDKVIFDVTISERRELLTRSILDYSGVVIDHNNFLTNYSDSVGFHHNQIIYNLLSDSISSHQFNTFPGFHKTIVFNGICNRFGIQPVTNNNDSVQMVTAYNKAIGIGQMAEMSNTYNDFFDYLRNVCSTYRIDESEIDVMESFFDGLSEIDIDDLDGNYLEGVLRIIDRSDLSSDLKQKLGNAMIVFNASAVIWGNSNLIELLEE